MNVLLLTSCNRIKQVLLSLSLNAQIIKEKFSVVIVDSSTPDIGVEEACDMHQSEDPYNVVKPYNYCSDVNLLYGAYKWFPQIEEFKVIHFQPRLGKQRGDSTSVALGLMQAALIGNRQNTDKQNYCLKLTGTSILVKDILSELPSELRDNDVITWHRANMGGYARSTRIFGCRPDSLVGYIAKEGWSDWCDDTTGVFEERFARFIERTIDCDKVNYTHKSEDGFLLEGGVAMQQIYGRVRIEKFIEDNNINTDATPWLNEFVNGGIW
jgi:hypothetical protein